MLKELILRNQGRMVEKIFVQRKVLFENLSKYDKKLDVDEMHSHFFTQFLYKTSGDFDIFRATKMDMLRCIGCQLRRIAKSVNPTNILYIQKYIVEVTSIVG